MRQRVVLDNTYATRVSRYAVIRMAHAHGVPVRGRLIATPIEEAYQNVVLRILDRYGKLLGPEELKELGKEDPNLPPPAAMAKWAATFEAPHEDEGFAGRREVLRRWIDDGFKVFFVSNQSGVASGSVTTEAVDACFARTIELLGLPVAEVAYCPHPAFPVGCFCRKPMPGLGVYLIHRHQLAREHLVMVGDMDSDRDFARGLGVRFVPAEEFFSGR